MKNKCPQCGKPNDDDYPIWVDGEIKEGGCQMCWEADSDRMWWDRVEYLQSLQE